MKQTNKMLIEIKNIFKSTRDNPKDLFRQYIPSLCDEIETLQKQNAELTTKVEGNEKAMPCEIGAIVWADDGTIIGKINSIQTLQSELFNGVRFSFTTCDYNNGQHLVHKIHSDELGKTVFLTKEEAEKALDEKGVKE